MPVAEAAFERVAIMREFSLHPFEMMTTIDAPHRLSLSASHPILGSAKMPQPERKTTSPRTVRGKPRTGKDRRKRRRLTQSQIFDWAKSHFRRTGSWPTVYSGAVLDADGESWDALNHALWRGDCGLPRGSSVARLLKSRGIKRTYRRWRPALTKRQILDWAEAFFQTHGHWPHTNSGPIAGAPSETWQIINSALSVGTRGLPGGLSIARLLQAAKGVTARPGGPPLTVRQILAWADAFFKVHGEWPRDDSGPVAEAPRESWANINVALRAGARGLRGKSSLLRLLQKHRGVLPGARSYPYRVSTSRRLSLKQIRAWAKDHRRRTGNWPHLTAGPIPGTDGLTWDSVDSALREGFRGLRGGSSLARLFGRKTDRRRE